MKITTVIVLYKQTIEQCKTVETLTTALLVQQNSGIEIEIILYDNSPKQQEFDSVVYPGLAITYVHDQRNLGINTAYNYAFNIAKKNGSDWLLLLDHDTEVTEEYVKQFEQLESFDNSIAAVVPIIHYENTMISPVQSNALRPLLAEKPVAGLQSTPIMAINSGALIRVPFLIEVGGFNERFPLDYLDHWLFHEIYAKGYKVYLLNTVLEHELSVMDYSRISLQRYQSILESEILFYKEYKKELLPAYRNQLIKRLMKQILLVKNKKIAAYTLKRLFSL